MPALSVDGAKVVARPLVEPEIWREVALVTIRGRPHSSGVGALVRKAMRATWIGHPALAVERRDRCPTRRSPSRGSVGLRLEVSALRVSAAGP